MCVLKLYAIFIFSFLLFYLFFFSLDLFQVSTDWSQGV